MAAGSHGGEGAPVGVLALGADERIAFADPQAEELLGARGLNGRALTEMLDRGQGDRFVELLARLAQGGTATAKFESAERCLELTLAQAEGMEEARVMALVTDVTEQVRSERGRERAEAELREAKSLLDTVVESASDAVFVKDRHGRYLLINAAGAEVLGHPVDDVVGRTDRDLMDPAVSRAIRDHDVEVMEGGEARTMEETLEVPGGRRVFLSAKAPYRDGEGNVAGLVGIARDITERKRSEEEQRLLAETTRLFEAAFDPAETVQRLADLTVSHFGELCVIDLLGEDGRISGVGVAATDEGAARELREVRRRWPIVAESAHPVARVLRSGRSEIVPELPDAVLRSIAQSDEHLELMRRLRYRSAVVVPLKARGRTLGTISVLHTGVERTYRPEDMALVEQMAQRAATALDNARLYEHQSTAAETLQRSLLPRELPRVEGVELAVRYEPGGPEVEVGGDWYDAVAADDGSLVFVIGDVAGRGLPAATIMGQLRNALRAYALEAEAPARALNRLDRFADMIDSSVMATVLYGRLDPGSGRLRYASAGHPPPLMTNGDARFLEGATRGPLGIGLPAEEAEHETVLGPSSTLLLYTDGLVERRGEDLADGLDRLRRHSEGAPSDTEGFCDHLLAALDVEGAGDDTALLALRRV